MSLLRPTPESYLTPENYKKNRVFRRRAIFILPMIMLNIMSGVSVAGIDAGKVYNTWPLMNGIFFSEKEYFKKIEVWKNFFENKFAV